MDFTELGLSKKEAIFYKELLTHGPQTVKALSASTGEQRTNCYLILQALTQSELIERDDSKPIARFRAKHPDQLKRTLLRQQQQLRSISQSLSEALPELASLYRLSTQEQGIAYFQGLDGYEAVHDDMNNASEVLSFINETIFVHQPKVYDLLQKKMKQRSAKHIPSRYLACQVTKPFIHTAHLSRSSLQVRALPAELFDGEITIYGQKVALTTYTRGSITTLVITDPAQAQTFRAIFEVLWQTTD